MVSPDNFWYESELSCQYASNRFDPWPSLYIPCPPAWRRWYCLIWPQYCEVVFMVLLVLYDLILLIKDELILLCKSSKYLSKLLFSPKGALQRDTECFLVGIGTNSLYSYCENGVWIFASTIVYFRSRWYWCFFLFILLILIQFREFLAFFRKQFPELFLWHFFSQ